MIGDAGLSNERTALAWQRTALSIVAGSVIIARLTWSDLGLTSLTALAGALMLGLWVLFESSIRKTRHTGRRAHRPARGGRATLALTTATALLAAVELVTLLIV